MSEDVGMTALMKMQQLPDFPAFEAFARALWRNEAAVMVGAGFSRMCTREPNSPLPPIWSTFKAEMQRSLGYDDRHAPDTLRLAQEYQTLHGDVGLNKLIHDMIPDQKWEPGPLHQKLMELPWRDVLTTNWDTLLERTKPKTPDRIYSCVRTIQDIAHQSRPRIVKLHGSLPSNTPFIFTEDDYRTYPSRFAPFVNLAQQVILEHDLCLIGFSGVDPNFLAWSGWVRDNLNVSARHIRLVGVLNLSPVSRSLLEKRNVTPIDLGPIVKDFHQDEAHKEAICIFFDALREAKPASPFEWARTAPSYSVSYNAQDSEKPCIEEVTHAWRKDRTSYPGWIAAPHRETYSLKKAPLHLHPSDESQEKSLLFAFEQIWRHKIAGIQLYYRDIEKADQAFDKAASALSPHDRTYLCGTIAAEWRREQNWNEWARWMSRLHEIGSEAASLRYSYESGQRAILNWDDDAVRDAAGELQSEEPIWMMRRAGLLSAIYQHREAAELYQAALLRIRQKLLHAPKDAWLISLEGWAALFHRISYVSTNNESDETRMRLIMAKADPWDHITRLEILASETKQKNSESSEKWKISFKSGLYKSNTNIILRSYHDSPFYELIDLIEMTGAPATMEHGDLFSKRLFNAFSSISSDDERDLLVFFARYAGSDKKILELMMPRMKVAQLSDESIMFFLEKVPKRIENLLNLEENNYLDNKVDFLIDLLSRILIRASSADALLNFERIILDFNKSRYWFGSYSSIESALGSAIEAMESADRQKAIDLALQMKTAGESAAQIMQERWPDLFEFFSKSDLEKFKVSNEISIRIDQLIDLVNTDSIFDRTDAVKRLHFLSKAGKLTENQSEKLKEAIWSQSDKNDWPNKINLLPWIFLELPGKYYAEQLFNDKIIDAIVDGDIVYGLVINLRIGLNLLCEPVPREKIISCVEACINWRPDPRTNQSEMMRSLSGIDQMDRATGSAIGELLACSLLPQLDKGDLSVDTAKKLCSQGYIPEIPTLVAAAYQIARLWPEKRNSAIIQIRSAIASRDPARVYAAQLAVRQFIEHSVEKKDFPQEIIELLLHSCEQRTQPGLSGTISLISEVEKNHSLSESEASRVAIALPIILEEYRYDQDNLEIPVMAELPLVRREVHNLANLLSNKNSNMAKIEEKLASDPLPEVRRLS
ncbi:MAG: SIR2 family protein [Oceanicaulis sp.]|nr:SIR2 family protein [Oceanicaulis sp.]